jgi:hypothetical protein
MWTYYYAESVSCVSVIAVKICPDSELHNPAIGGVQGQVHTQSTPTSPLSLAARARAV